MTPSSPVACSSSLDLANHLWESCSEHPEVLGHSLLNLAALPSAREVMRCTTAVQQRPASGKRAQWPANPLVREP
jgi:hypothetical protein